MCLLIWLLVGVVVAFFMYKKAEAKPLRHPWYTNPVQDTDVFMKIAVTCVFWPISIPIIGLWKLLDYLYNKFNNKPKK